MKRSSDWPNVVTSGEGDRSICMWGADVIRREVEVMQRRGYMINAAGFLEAEKGEKTDCSLETPEMQLW